MSTGGDETTSEFTVTVSQACVEGVSNNLRICWGPDLCNALVFQPGDVDLGLLSAEVEQGVPEPGSGVEAETPAATVALPATGVHDTGGRDASWFSALLTALGLVGVAISWSVFRRVRR
jgi:hypothetical protein